MADAPQAKSHKKGGLHWPHFKAAPGSEEALREVRLAAGSRAAAAALPLRAAASQQLRCSHLPLLSDKPLHPGQPAPLALSTHARLAALTHPPHAISRPPSSHEVQHLRRNEGTDGAPIIRNETGLPSDACDPKVRCSWEPAVCGSGRAQARASLHLTCLSATPRLPTLLQRAGHLHDKASTGRMEDF